MSSLSRRQFATGSLGLTTAALTARAYDRVIGANDRMRIGVIGCGSQAGGHMRDLVKMRESDNLELTAVCDVFDKRAAAAAQLTGGKIVKDYRRLLDDKDIDYVLIATPEHWHMKMTLDAADAHKHIYCEKPMTRTVEESKRVVAKIKATSGIKMQVGVQGMSDDSYEAASRYVKEGVLGKVVLAQIDYSRNHEGDFMNFPIDPDARPGQNLDWNAWLGSAPKRAFDPERFFRWRNYWDYASGIASDLFVHRVTRIIKSLDLTFPAFGTGSGGKFEFTQSKNEIPDTLNMLLDYPGGLTVQLISSMANERRVDHLLRGHRATLQFTNTGFSIRPERQYANDPKWKETPEIVHQKSGAESLGLHHRNLLNAIRKNEALKCDVMLGYYGVVAVQMGNLSYRRRKYMKWDAARQRIVAA
ncbi:MAG TPA: Gfo/Idh/MocA family oxidoreductase [Bryobacteraceae bacterium]|jgi:predicted dehydrogenase|nr:Gfo/Idh/MocA family oxidoreductase [Bryobacteraceae bacterium]